MIRVSNSLALGRMKMSFAKSQLSILYLTIAFGATPVAGSTLPFCSTFDNDLPGQPPALGGPSQPSSLYVPPGTSITVESSANGLSTQPVVLYDGGSNNYMGMNYSFSPVSGPVVRVEATVSVDHFVSGYFLQTTKDNAVISRLWMISNGNINHSGIIVGQYQPNSPFRVRMDVDMINDQVSASVDNELNGFSDDPVYSGIPFVNDPSILPYMNHVLADLNTLQGQSATTLAYDDICAEVIPEPGSLGLLAVGSLVLACGRRVPVR